MRGSYLAVCDFSGKLGDGDRSLEVMRTILNRAARAYRDDDGRPWLGRLPPLIAMLPESPRRPYPITWEEQDKLRNKRAPATITS